MAPFLAAIVAPFYSFGRDMFLYLKGERDAIKDLEDRISTLITHLTSIKSQKHKIDQSLCNSVRMEKSDEYPVIESRVEVVRNRYIKFIKKYRKISGNPLSLTADESMLITELENLKSIKVRRFRFFKLANLSKDIDNLNKQASEVLDRLTLESMTCEKSGTIQEMLDDSEYNLPVFDTYVAEVLDYLFEEGHSTVGIFGPKGVGKTTVMKKLYNQLIECRGDSSSELKHVIMTEYPEELETQEKIVEKLQKEIMCQLSIEHEASRTGSIQQNRNTISAFLREKKHILLMDHVSREVDLGELGLTQKAKYKKVVMASTEINPVSRMTQHKIEIKRLEKEEGLVLFKNICGKLNDDYMIPVADRIIDCCGGIPWVIRHLATLLKYKKDAGYWYHVKRVMQSQSKSIDLIDLQGFDKVYEMTYDKLDRETKKCLLYGALFPIQHKIYADYLVECWIAEGFIFADDAHKVRATRDYGQAILQNLTDKHLLQWCCDQQYIIMPPIFRRLALALDYPDDENCVIWTSSNDGMPNAETWRVVKRMSLIGCNIELPQSPESCNIYTLLLQSLKPNLETLADLFFLHMKKLQVLDLNHTEIRALPESINCLENLKSLYLNDCMHLEILPPEAAKLEKLEFLDICGTSIPSLPQEIRHMVDLRCLRASLSVERFINNSKGKQVQENLQIIPKDIIRNLRKLEELSINTTFDSEGGIALAEELASLKYLNKLCFNFPDVMSLDTFLRNSTALNDETTHWGSDTLRSFKISIGGHETQHPYEPDFSGILAERWLRYYSTNGAFTPACQELLNHASAFEIIGHHGVESLNQFDLHSVKACVVGSCNKLKCIVDGYTASEELGFGRGRLPQNLEKLYLYNLDFLEYICDGPVPSQGLSNLTAIAINGCNKLTKILDPALAYTLQSLEKLKVENCCKVLEIIEVDGRSNNSGRGETSEIVEVPEESSNSEQRDLSSILKSLRTIEMSNLPELQRICTSESISWKSLNSIIVKSCSKLSNLSLTSTNAKKLRLIQGEENWWSSLMFSDDQAQRLLPLFHPLTRESSEPGPGAGPEGAASSSGQSDFNRAVMAHFGEAVTEYITSSNNSSIDPPVPLDNDAQRELEEQATINESHIDIQAEGFSPEDGIPVVPRVQDFGIYLNNGVNGGENRREQEEKEESVEPLTVEELREEGGLYTALNDEGRMFLLSKESELKHEIHFHLDFEDSRK